MTSEKLTRVLCINDSDITLFILKRALSKSNFSERVVERTNGQEALKYCEHLIKTPGEFEDTYPTVIFLDLHMPVMDGWEFLDRFSNDISPFFKETKIVITSLSVGNDDSIRAKKYPFVIDFLNSLISVEYLTKLHENLLKGSSFQY